MIRLVLLFLVCLISVSSSQQTPGDPPNVHVFKDIVLGFEGDVAFSTTKSHNKTVMCVFDSWSINREGPGKFGLEYVDATLCTHLLFRFVEIEDESGTGNFVLKNNDAVGTSEDLYRQAVDLKKQNPKLKVMLSVGGWKEGVKDFQNISANYNFRLNFVNNAVKFLKDRKLDGLNVEWMWPGPFVAYRGGKESDKDAVTDLITSLSNKMKAQNLELGLTLPADFAIIEAGYNIPAFEGSLDYLIIMGQDLAGSWGKVAGHHSPLLPLTGTGRTVGKTVKYVLEKNVSPHKVILGIPFVGRTFKLADPQVGGSGLGASTVEGEGFVGAFNKDDKVLNYNEICHVLHGNEWTVYEDTEAKVPFMKDGKGNWVSFDDTKSVRAKVEFGEERGLGGYAAWTITTDDFKGDLCDGGIKYPLLRTINYVLSKKRSAESEGSPTSRHDLDITTNHTLSQSSKPTFSQTTKKPESEQNQNSTGNNISSFIPGILVAVILCANQVGLLN